MGILDPRASVAADKAYLKLTDIVDASSDFAPASALTRLAAVEAFAGIVTRPNPPTTTAQPSAWLRADQISGLTSGASVQNWASATGVGDATPSTLNGGTAPTYLTNAVAGKPAVRFTKAGASKMKFGLASYAKAADHTILVVARHPNLANALHLLQGFNATNGVDASAAMALRATVSTAGVFSTGPFSATGATFSTASPAITANTWNLFSMDYSPAYVPTAVLNGVVGSTGVGASDTPGTLTSLALGGYGTNFGDVDYAEIIYFGTQLSSADRKTWEQYLGACYSLTVAA